jgi:hypothetical protein
MEHKKLSIRRRRINHHTVEPMTMVLKLPHLISTFGPLPTPPSSKYTKEMFPKCDLQQLEV